MKKMKFDYILLSEVGMNTFIMAEVAPWGETIATYTAYYDIIRKKYKLYPRTVRAPYNEVGNKKEIAINDIKGWR